MTPANGRRGGGFGLSIWIPVLALVLVAAATTWRIRDMLAGHGSRAQGDGTHPSTYGFVLQPCLVDRETIVGCGLPRDGLPVLDFPPLLDEAEINPTGHGRRSKYLVPGDRVIGMVLNGRSRAYPIRILNWHEIVNDTLGGVPIAVTYSPLCDAAVVFSRRLAEAQPVEEAAAGKAGAEGDERQEGLRAKPDEPVLLFGHSGLLYNSDLLLYDRPPDSTTAFTSSLWSQIQGRAIAGPAAARGDSLGILSCALLPWSEWRNKYPGTTVLARDPARLERYSRDPYSSYYGSDLLRFPVRPLPPKDEFPYKTPCLILGYAGQRLVCPLPVIARHADADGHWSLGLGGCRFQVRYCAAPPAAWATALSDSTGSFPGPQEIFYSFWFAYFATHPQAQPVR